MSLPGAVRRLRRAVAAAKSGSKPKKAALGRVPIVRRKQEGGRERPSLLARILGAF